jgi:hypothetical protein
MNLRGLRAKSICHFSSEFSTWIKYGAFAYGYRGKPTVPCSDDS